MQRTNHRRLALALAAGLLFVCNVSAQNEPVHNWAAPLYWQPSAHEAALMKQAGEAQRGSQEQPQAAGAPAGATAPLVFVGITPCRMLDTRGYDPTFVSGTVYGPPAMPAGYRVIPSAGVTAGYCSIPSTAQALSLNVTLAPNAGSAVEYIELWPDGATFPTVSTMNDLQGQMVSNAAVVPLGSDGAYDVLVTSLTNLFIDMNGYYAAPSALALGGGLVGSPALTFGDPTTGLYSTGAGTVDIATDGSSRATVSPTGLSVAGNVSASGNLDFGGMITQYGTPLLGTNAVTGYYSLYLGDGALANQQASYNSALGYGALAAIQTGYQNTAAGYGAGAAIVSNYDDVAVGFQALWDPSTWVSAYPAGSYDTAVGAYAGELTTGSNNTYIGYMTGMNPTGDGPYGSGSLNTFVGSASGETATTAYDDAFVGAQSGQHITTGSQNTFMGYEAGWNVSSGSNNTFVGYAAGGTATTGSYNIYIANVGTSSPDTESYTTRIGSSNQNRTFISGIRGVTTGVVDAIPVLIDENGQLGTTSSSRRFKTDIADMGDTTDTLMSLRPVQFRYIAHGPASPLQYGLIAEDVAEVAPELVAHNANGEIETVFYDKVNAMLLNQVQTQQRLIESQKAQFQSQLESQKEQFTGLISQLESRLAELESRVK